MNRFNSEELNPLASDGIITEFYEKVVQHIDSCDLDQLRIFCKGMFFVFGLDPQAMNEACKRFDTMLTAFEESGIIAVRAADVMHQANHFLTVFGNIAQKIKEESEERN